MCGSDEDVAECEFNASADHITRKATQRRNGEFIDSMNITDLVLLSWLSEALRGEINDWATALVLAERKKIPETNAEDVAEVASIATAMYRAKRGGYMRCRCTFFTKFTGSSNRRLTTARSWSATLIWAIAACSFSSEVCGVRHQVTRTAVPTRLTDHYKFDVDFLYHYHASLNDGYQGM